MTERRDKEQFEKLLTREQIRNRMEEILRSARTKEQAENSIKDALKQSGLMFLGPMVIWTEAKGAINALLLLREVVDPVQREVLHREMIKLLELPQDEREQRALELLVRIPTDEEHGFKNFDLVKSFSRRSALVQILDEETHKSYGVEARCEVINDSN